jgi:hypothetical protein
VNQQETAGTKLSEFVDQVMGRRALQWEGRAFLERKFIW